MPTVQPGFKDMHAKMDEHVKREDKRPTPRRTNDRRTTGGKFAKSQHREVTKGVRVKRGETVVYPYGGETIRNDHAQHDRCQAVETDNRGQARPNR